MSTVVDAMTEKVLNDKIFETSFPIKKVIFILVARCLLSFKSDFGPRNGFLSFSQKITHFWKKLVNNKIFNTSFVIKTVMLIFSVRCPLFLKNCQMGPQNSFLQIQLFSKKLLNKKNIQYQISDKKGYIHFWRKMTPDRSHSDTVGRVANKVYSFLPKYRSSDALLRQRFFFFYPLFH